MGTLTPPALLLACSLCGCSILLETNDAPDGGTPVADAEPPTFGIESMEASNAFPGFPLTEFAERKPLFEGVGTAGGATAWVVLSGELIPDDLGVTVEFAQTAQALPALGMLEVLDVQVGGDGTVAAVEFRIKVDPSFEGERAIELKLSGTGIPGEDLPAATAETLNSSLVLVGLPEFLVPAGQPATMTAQDLAYAYSEIEVLAKLDLSRDASNEAARFRSASSTRIAAVVEASGFSGQTSVLGESGPGGCRGGLGGAGDCDQAGGATADPGVGGGGGGHGEAGVSGVPIGAANTGHGKAGSIAGDALFSAGLTGGGGGASGAIVLDKSYGGGGGGGIILLQSRGVVDISAGALRANGGDGGENDGTFLNSSGGGAGAGGGILLRAEAGLVSDGASNLRAIGGDGGIGDASNNGGNGGVGRIRIDNQSGANPASLPEAALGAILVSPDSRVLRTDSVSLTVIGQDVLTDFRISVNDKEFKQDLIFDATSKSDIFDDLSLDIGLNLVCGYATQDATQVAKYCIELVRLP